MKILIDAHPKQGGAGLPHGVHHPRVAVLGDRAERSAAGHLDLRSRTACSITIQCFQPISRRYKYRYSPAVNWRVWITVYNYVSSSALNKRIYFFQRLWSVLPQRNRGAGSSPRSRTRCRAPPGRTRPFKAIALLGSGSFLRRIKFSLLTAFGVSLMDRF